MVRRGSTLMVLLAFSLAACSSSSDDASPTTTPPVESTTTAAPTTTTTTPPTTTAAPTTTTDPATTLAAQVEADLLEAFRLANDALQDPFNTEFEAAALELRTGFALRALQEKLQEYRSANLAIRPNSRVEASMTVEQPASLVVEGGDVVELQACEIDPWVVVEVGAGPNGSDAQVEPNVFAYRSIILLRLEDQVWKVEGGTELASWEGVEECPPA